MTEKGHPDEGLLASDLISRYKKQIYGLARRLASGTGIEDDIFQNAFVRAFRWIRDNPGVDIGGLEGFLRRCTRLAAIDLHRKRARIPEALQDMDSFGVIAGESRLISHLDLERYIDKLPEKQRSVVALTLEGFTEKEIAATLGISATHVGVLMHRGKANLRSFLTRRGQPTEQDEEK